MKDKKFVLTIFLSLFLIFNLSSKIIKICLFDTANLEKYRLQNFIKIAKSVDYKIDYKSFAQILDSDPNQLQLNDYDGIFLILGIEFLQGMAKSPACHKILQLIHNYGQNSNKLIALFLPSIGGIKIENKAAIFAPIFARIGLNVNTPAFQLITNHPDKIKSIDFTATEKGLEYFSKATKHFLSTPIETKCNLYHTTLSTPKESYPTIPNLGLNTLSVTLPIKQNGSEKIRPIFPYGIYFFDPIQKNHIFVSSSSFCTFSGISENFHICPMSFALRRQIHENLQETLWELNKITSQKNVKNFSINFKNIEQNKKPSLPNKIATIGCPIDKKEQNKFIKKVAWMDIGLFERNENTQNPSKDTEKQKELFVESVIKSGPDLTLWITMNPQEYYSPIAKHLNKKEIFLSSLKDLTFRLKNKAYELQTTPPKILIGYEITNNIYPPNYPKNFAIDLYENNYFDIPNPLNSNFWENEIKKPLECFLNEWSKPETNNGIEIAGIVLDLEMYCRKTTGTFLATMGFDTETLKEFIKEDGKQNIHYLLKEKGLQKYFVFLEEQAKKLGLDLKSYFNTKIPNGIIACYAPNISTDWFYKGFYRGLSTKAQPIQLLTFNSEFKIHQKWLEQNKIFANHSSVLMLSKLKGSLDFWWVNHILEHNHGIWFNKFSKFSEGPSDWIEASPMSREDQLKFFEYIKKID